jgi:hypothetical protein
MRAVLAMKMSMLQLEVEGRLISMVGFGDEGSARAFADARVGLVVVLGDCDHPTPFWVVSREDAEDLCSGGYELAPSEPAYLPLGIRRLLN